MARILDLLQKGPMMRAELAAALSVPSATIHWNLNRLMAAPRQVRVSSWVRTGGQPARQFSLGDAPDAPFEALHTVRKKKVDMAEINLALLVKALATPQSAADLALVCRCSMTYVRKHMAMLMAETPRRIYVKEWRRPDGPGGLAMVYAAGTRRDAKKPNITQAQRFEELKADPEKHKRSLELRQLATARRKMRGKPQNIFAALGI